MYRLRKSEVSIPTNPIEGDTYTKIGDEGDWTKIRYKDTEAYVSSSYVTEVDSAGGTESAEGAAPADGGAAPASGSVTVNDDSVRVRSSADTSSDSNIIGKANSGETYTLKGEADGWYQIDFKGQTGYIKGEFATKN